MSMTMTTTEYTVTEIMRLRAGALDTAQRVLAGSQAKPTEVLSAAKMFSRWIEKAKEEDDAE